MKRYNIYKDPWFVFSVIFLVFSISINSSFLFASALLFFLITLFIGIDKTKKQTMCEKLKKYSIDPSQTNRLYTRVLTSDNCSYIFDTDEILDKNKQYADILITRAITIEEQKRRLKFKQQLTNGECNGLTARCTNCKYLWKIKKDKHIPANCPNCRKHTVTVIYEDNRSYHQYLLR